MFKRKSFFEKYFDSHVCHDSIASSSCVKNVVSHACSTSFSTFENDIRVLKKSIDCLNSTLSQCAMNHTRLESIFRKKHAPHLHAHPSRHTHDTMYARVYICTHCGRTGHLAKLCYDRLNVSNFASKNIWVRKGTTLMDPRKCGYQNPLLLHLM